MPVLYPTLTPATASQNDWGESSFLLTNRAFWEEGPTQDTSECTVMLTFPNDTALFWLGPSCWHRTGVRRKCTYCKFNPLGTGSPKGWQTLLWCCKWGRIYLSSHQGILYGNNSKSCFWVSTEKFSGLTTAAVHGWEVEFSSILLWIWKFP
jgi:hypothetical protein